MNAMKSVTLVLLVGGSAVPCSGQVVVPAGFENVEANAHNSFPFDCDPQPSMRYQQVYLGSEVGTGGISEIRFRQDGTFGDPFGPTVLPAVTVQLSSTTTAHPFGFPVGMSLTFADNVGPDVRTVFSGDLVLSSEPSGSIPKPFEILVPFDQVFYFDPSAGAHLLVDMTLPACVGNTPMDAQSAIDDSVARAVSGWLQDAVEAASELHPRPFHAPAVQAGGWGA